MGLIGIQWGSVRLSGGSVGVIGAQWGSVGVSGTQWVSVVLSGAQCAMYIHPNIIDFTVDFNPNKLTH